MKLITLYIIFQFFLNFNVFASENSISLENLKKNSNNKVVFMRHAQLPAMGTPLTLMFQIVQHKEILTKQALNKANLQVLFLRIIV